MSNITLSRPAGSAVLRRLLQPLYDTTVLPAVGTNIISLLYFRLPIGNNMPVTAVAKTEADTNLTAAGMVGTPEMFALEGFNIEFCQHTPRDVANNVNDLEAFYGQSVFSFFFGQQRPWLEVPLTQIPTGVYPDGRLGMGDTAGNEDVAYVGMGMSSVKEAYNFTVDGRPIMLRSAEPFHAEVTWPNTAPWQLTSAANQRVRCYMLGTLYASL